MPSLRTATATATPPHPDPRPDDAQSDAPSRRRTVVLLGIDGAGKTTVGRTIVADLRDSGTPAQLLRNPAGRRWMSRMAERLGIAALSPAWANRAESVVRGVNVLVAHARAARFAGTTVMDRHAACQLVLRAVRGLPQGVLLQWLTIRLPRPDAVILIDVPPGLAYDRIIARGEDCETLEYLQAARTAYLELALARGWHIIDGSGTPQQVAAQTRLAAGIGL